MHLERIVLRGFRNLRDLDLTLPPEGAVLLGQNAQGKTNFLEAVGYPVLFRALRGAPDSEVVGFGSPGFRLEVAFAEAGHTRTAVVAYTAADRKKRITLDDAPVSRLSEAVGAWVAVAFLPRDVALAGGPAPERRQYLDRMLSLASADHLRALARYRAALSQRNAALRTGQDALARAFDAPLAEAGAVVMRARLHWVSTAAPRFAEGFAAVGEPGVAELSYRGDGALADVGGWAEGLDRARGRDLARRMTTVGPHRDDLVLTVGGRSLRDFGSTGQLRSAAVALRLLERDTIEAARGVTPALLLDDVFAELDADRQARLADQLRARRRGQVFITAPRQDELPAGLALPVWTVSQGTVTAAA